MLITKNLVSVNKEDYQIMRCSICFENIRFPQQAILKCQHGFHFSCLKEWFKESQTCPICRQNISNCLKCNGTQQIKQYEYGVVIPKQYREDPNIRNHTNGLFEIYNYDLERLLLNSIYIDNKESNINIYVSV